MLATALFALVPGGPLDRLANYDEDGPDPHYDARVDAGAIRRAADVLPDDARYFVYVSGYRSLLQGNLKAAGQLFFAPALPVQDLRRAQWVLSYHSRPLLPSGVRAQRLVRVGPDVYLAQVRS